MNTDTITMEQRVADLLPDTLKPHVHNARACFELAKMATRFAPNAESMALMVAGLLVAGANMGIKTYREAGDARLAAAILDQPAADAADVEAVRQAAAEAAPPGMDDALGDAYLSAARERAT